MGLDCYWMFSAEQVQDGDFSDIEDYNLEEEDNVWSGVAREAGASIVPTFNRELEEDIVVGMVVGGRAPDSFRGKAYHSVVKDIADHSIRQDLTNDEVRRIADALEEAEWDDLSSRQQEVFAEQVAWDEFVLMWRRFADAGAWMHAWY